VAAIVVRVSSPLAKSTESIARQVADAAAHPAETHAVLIGDRFIWLMVPAVLAAVWLAWRRAAGLALAAAVFSLVGWIAVVALASQDALLAQAGHPEFARAQAVALTKAWSDGGVVSTYATMFVIGHVVGTVLLGAALWRARAIPRWAAAFVAVSMPLHLVAFLTNVKALDLAAETTLLIGFAACAVQILHATSPHAGIEPIAHHDRAVAQSMT
jgi:hypothetical protein